MKYQIEGFTQKELGNKMILSILKPFQLGRQIRI
jgi:hypothetical protein